MKAYGTEQMYLNESIHSNKTVKKKKQKSKKSKTYNFNDMDTDLQLEGKQTPARQLLQKKSNIKSEIVFDITPSKIEGDDRQKKIPVSIFMDQPASQILQEQPLEITEDIKLLIENYKLMFFQNQKESLEDGLLILVNKSEKNEEALNQCQKDIISFLSLKEIFDKESIKFCFQDNEVKWKPSDKNQFQNVKAWLQYIILGKRSILNKQITFQPQFLQILSMYQSKEYSLHQAQIGDYQESFLVSGLEDPIFMECYPLDQNSKFSIFRDGGLQSLPQFSWIIDLSLGFRYFHQLDYEECIEQVMKKYYDKFGQKGGEILIFRQFLYKERQDQSFDLLNFDKILQKVCRNNLKELHLLFILMALQVNYDNHKTEEYLQTCLKMVQFQDPKYFLIFLKHIKEFLNDSDCKSILKNFCTNNRGKRISYLFRSQTQLLEQVNTEMKNAEFVNLIKQKKFYQALIYYCKQKLIDSEDNEENSELIQLLRNIQLVGIYKYQKVKQIWFWLQQLKNYPKMIFMRNQNLLKIVKGCLLLLSIKMNTFNFQLVQNFQALIYYLGQNHIFEENKLNRYVSNLITRKILEPGPTGKICLEAASRQVKREQNIQFLKILKVIIQQNLSSAQIRQYLNSYQNEYGGELKSSLLGHILILTSWNRKIIKKAALKLCS